MPTNYNGNPSGLTAGDTVTISDPDDAELASAASNALAPKKLADYVQFILNASGFLGVARTWTAIQTFTNTIKATGPSQFAAMFQSDSTWTGYKLVDQIGGGSQKRMRLYVDNLGEPIFTINCAWDGTHWNEDVNASHHRFFFDQNGDFFMQTVPGGSASFIDTAWTYVGTAHFNLLDLKGTATIGGDADVAGDANVTGHVSGTDLALTSNPAKTAAANNLLTALSIPKVFGLLTVTLGAGGGPFTLAITDGCNVGTPVRVNATTLRIVFAQPFTAQNYSTLWGSCRNSSGAILPQVNVSGSGKQLAYVEIFFSQYSSPGSAIDMDATSGAITLDFGILGRQ